MYVISGYQKSGTEWLKFMLVDLFMGPLETWAEYTQAIPGVRDEINLPKCGWVKTHEVEVPRQDFIQGVLHTIRHPLDVAISTYRYRLVIDAGQDHDYVMGLRPAIVEYLKFFIEVGGDPVWAAMNGGLWEDSIKAAINDERVVTVLHEDLRSGLGPRILQDALASLGFSFSRDEIEAAFLNHTPEKMRERDDRNFLAKIQMGQYEEYCTPDMLAKARDTFPTALQLGYKI